ncbi:hypothetical protein LEP1GSC202_1471 [Leptospira yanagawae serovar Saopaulo str. Sao Paulo = ATCC 700523]|uniref:Uncharacterized protein n=2 Tax=Leptospira yanagawae TaxID=293069 RepID=A0ABY2M5B3_9LEPT|nr:hypothetical protein [Leptospira yanagawae]EOQ88749.1 hypothetical protein LEP1GSC202_1471 [Leptospira yanagawae serovar Saopaulo str. Sao Paulo = ATCC 700523]TGL24400.1 hypothetical protein EHQ46_04600 [Leptospira yanagawae]
MLLTDLFRFNPLNLFLPPKVVPKSNYKVTLLLGSLKKVIQTEIIAEDPDLESLEVGSSKGEVILTGTYRMEWLWIARFLKVQSIRFRVRLKPVLVKDNKARLKIVGYRAWDTKPRRFDIVRWFVKIDPFHKKKVFESIMHEAPHILSITGLQWELLFDLNYFLNLVPAIAGKIEIQYLVADHNELYIFVRSSTILKPLVDFFGPEYLKIDYIEEDRDVQMLLWENE